MARIADVPRATVTLRVTKNGHRVAGAWVSAHTRLGDGPAAVAVASARTDDHGVATLKAAAGAVTVQVVNPPLGVPNAAPGPLHLDAGSATTVELSFQ